MRGRLLAEARASSGKRFRTRAGIMPGRWSGRADRESVNYAVRRRCGGACRDLSRLPFRRLCDRSRALRSESPADFFSGCGILLLVSGLDAV